MRHVIFPNCPPSQFLFLDRLGVRPLWRRAASSGQLSDDSLHHAVVNTPVLNEDTETAEWYGAVEARSYYQSCFCAFVRKTTQTRIPATSSRKSSRRRLGRSMEVLSHRVAKSADSTSGCSISQSGCADTDVRIPLMDFDGLLPPSLGFRV